MPKRSEHTAQDRERRLQVGASLLLGAVVLVVIALRAGNTFFTPAWWRPW